MTRIVSITELPIVADSRALKMAATFARAGYQSLVVDRDGKMPRELADLPITFSSLHAPQPADAGSSAQGVSVPRRAIGRRRGATMQPLLDPIRLLVDRRRMNAIDGPKQAAKIPEADLYYVHGPTYSSAVQRRAAEIGAAIIYDVHDFYQLLRKEFDGGTFYNRHLIPIYRRREESLIAVSSAVVTVSGDLAGHLNREFGCEVAVIRNCHDSRLDASVVRPLRSRISPAPKSTLIVCPGHNRSSFRTDKMLEILRGLPGEYELAFIGKGWSDLCATAADAGLAGRIHDVGVVPAGEVVPLLRQSDLLWLPRRAPDPQNLVALPNGFFQALAAGRPVVFSSQLPECVRLAKGAARVHLADPDNVVETIAAIRAAAADVARPISGADGPQLDWENEEKTLLELVAAVLKSRRRPS